MTGGRKSTLVGLATWGVMARSSLTANRVVWTDSQTREYPYTQGQADAHPLQAALDIDDPARQAKCRAEASLWKIPTMEANTDGDEW